ncbi:MAG: ABC transporter substrate-binding protein [Pikeienuella sp.]
MLKTFSLAALLAAGTAVGAFAQEPQRGGVLNFTAPYGSSFATLDGQASPSIQEMFVTEAIHRSLYTWDAVNNEPVLELADSVEISDDGLTYTYHIRPNAVFHNGKALTADDFIFSYKRMADPKNAFPGAKQVSTIKGGQAFIDGQAEEIEGLKKIDDKTLEITFVSTANPGFALMERTTAIYPSDVDPATQALNPVGLGPFIFKEHIPGSQASFERFDNYYEEGLPYLDRLNVILMAEGSARDVAFRNREIDVSILGPTQYQAYQADEALKDHILEVAEVFTRNIGFSQKIEPLADKRVRQAINYAINSRLIIEKLAKNKAFPATGWLPVSSPAFDPNQTPYEYDPEKAKALLAEAGYADGFEFEVTASPNESWGVPIVEAILPMLQQVGITVRPRPVESGALASHITSGDFQAYIWSNTSGPDPLSAMRCFYSKTPQSACNYTAFSNAEFDKVFEAAEAERDPAKQLDLLRQANNIVQEEAPVWFFNYNKAVMAYQPWVHGLAANATEMAMQPYDEIWLDDSAPDSRK